MDTLLQDVRYAARQFVRQPLFALVAILSLGLAIGGNSLIYGMIDGFVLHPFPYPEPDRLVSVGVTFPKLSADTSYVEVLSASRVRISKPAVPLRRPRHSISATAISLAATSPSACLRRSSSTTRSPSSG